MADDERREPEQQAEGGKEEATPEDQAAQEQPAAEEPRAEEGAADEPQGDASESPEDEETSEAEPPEEVEAEAKPSEGSESEEQEKKPPGAELEPITIDGGSNKLCFIPHPSDKSGPEGVRDAIDSKRRELEMQVGQSLVAHGEPRRPANFSSRHRGRAGKACDAPGRARRRRSGLFRWASPQPNSHHDQSQCGRRQARNKPPADKPLASLRSLGKLRRGQIVPVAGEPIF